MTPDTNARSPIHPWKGEGLVAEQVKRIKMVGILSKIAPPAYWLNSKVSGIAVAAAAAGIVVLWKKKLDELSSKR